MRYRNPLIVTVLCAFAATAALAHSGVKNEAVKTWMQTMSSIGKHTKVLGNMYKGTLEFDAAEARRAAKAIARQSAKIPSQFEAPASDPKSEALPVIWDDFADFSAKADELRQAAAAAAEQIRTRADLRAALGQIGGACQTCHQTYRE